MQIQRAVNFLQRIPPKWRWWLRWAGVAYVLITPAWPVVTVAMLAHHAPSLWAISDVYFGLKWENLKDLLGLVFFIVLPSDDMNQWNGEERRDEPVPETLEQEKRRLAAVERAG